MLSLRVARLLLRADGRVFTTLERLFFSRALRALFDARGARSRCGTAQLSSTSPPRSQASLATAAQNGRNTSAPHSANMAEDTDAAMADAPPPAPKKRTSCCRWSRETVEDVKSWASRTRRESLDGRRQERRGAWAGSVPRADGDIDEPIKVPKGQTLASSGGQVAKSIKCETSRLFTAPWRPRPTPSGRENTI